MTKGLIRKIQLNNKGLTLLEAVIAILLISMVSVGVTSLFFSMSRLSKLSNTQLNLNTTMRVIKENVAQSIRKGTDINGNVGVKASTAAGETDKTLEDLSVETSSGQVYSYVFDLTYVSATDGVEKYWVTIKRDSGGEVLTKYSIEIYAGVP